MRESVFFEVRLDRFEVWRIAVTLVAGVAMAVLVAWAMAMLDSQTATRCGLLVALAFLGVATLGLAWSLGRVERGVLASLGGVWSFAPDHGHSRSGPLIVAVDLGSFLLLRLGDRRRSLLWLPVQRRGLERQWHALRCAVYAPPDAAPTASAP